MAIKKNRIIYRKDLIIFIVGFCILILGWSVYAFLRPVSQVPYTAIFTKHLEYDIPFLGSLPSLIHTLSISLLLSYFLKSRKQSIPAILIWGLVALTLEAVQHDNACAYLEKFVYRDFNGIFCKLYWYSKTGVFDSYDVLSILLGLVIALMIDSFSKSTKNRIDKK